jgi:hypothetical protein
LVFSLNDKASVVLTQNGANVLNKSNTTWNSWFEDKNISHRTKTDYKVGDVYTVTAWQLFATFGNSFSWGEDSPFLENNITVTQN